MAESYGPDADPGRAALMDSVRLPSTFEEITAAIGTYVEHSGSVYVERLEEKWRWSPAHRGGVYPLLREVARFMRVDHYRIIVPFKTVANGWAVVKPDDDDDDSAPPVGTAVLTFKEPATPEAVKARLTEAFGLSS